MNETIKTQLNHKTVRKFEKKEIPEEVFKTLLEVANHTATSTGMQNFSIIRVKDEKKRERIVEIAGQAYLKDCPELLIFLVDTLRNDKIARENGFVPNTSCDLDKFFQGFTDAALAMQNMTVAIESLGMGAVYFGSVLNDIERLCEVLELPPLTFPVLGMGFGYPAENPQLKPKMPVEFKVFLDKYETLPNYMEAIKEYDEEMTNYYDTRDNGRRSDSFSRQVVSKLTPEIEAKRCVADVMEKQGFNLRLKREKEI